MSTTPHPPHRGDGELVDGIYSPLPNSDNEYNAPISTSRGVGDSGLLSKYVYPIALHCRCEGQCENTWGRTATLLWTYDIST
jgi:hypothetical protein